MYFHKPKTYKSTSGCCICGVKSSTSRFTDSAKYEHLFQRCFRIAEDRSGDICNACVLLVKRFKSLPGNTDKHWNHMIDSRAGPGCRGISRNKKYHSRRLLDNGLDESGHDDFCGHPSGSADSSVSSPLSSDDSGMIEEDFYKEEFPRKRRSKSTPQKFVPLARFEHKITDFIDKRFWIETQTCCGTVFRHIDGGVDLLDVNAINPCYRHQTKKPKEPNVGIPYHVSPVQCAGKEED